MIVAAALCPWPPLLVRELTGADPVLPELRAACDAAVAAVLAAGPGVVVVAGPGPATERLPADGRLDVAAFGGLPGPSAAAARPALPPAPGIGAYLLDRAGYAGRRVIWSVSEDEPPGKCARLGADLAGTAERTGLLVLGDGSARRGPKAPGHFDERAAAFDAAVEEAVRAGDLGALLDIDPALARDLMATGRPAWQLLAGALRAGARPEGAGGGPAAPAVDVQYAGDPFGVKYLVASLIPSLS
ncbi:MAG: hypothetical protein ACHP9Z_19785 [Streptosporangiales bacterium]